MDEDFVPKARKPKPVREKRVEANHRDRVRDAGGESYKWVSPGRAGVMDRIDIFGVEPMVRKLSALFVTAGLSADEWRVIAIDLLAAAIRFTECKAPNGRLTPNQEREINRMRARGFTVNVVNQP